MTKEEIIEMAEQAGFMFYRGSPLGFTYSMLKDFAKLVAENEREKCAKIAGWHKQMAFDIKARGQE